MLHWFRQHTVKRWCALGTAGLLLLDSSLALVGQSTLWGTFLPLSIGILGIFYMAIGIYYAVILVKMLTQARWCAASGLVMLFALQVGACMALHASASRQALADAESVTVAFLKAPDSERVHFADDVEPDILATLRGQQFNLTLAFAYQPMQRFEFLVRPLRGRAFIIQLQRNRDEDRFLLYFPGKEESKNIRGGSAFLTPVRRSTQT